LPAKKTILKKWEFRYRLPEIVERENNVCLFKLDEWNPSVKAVVRKGNKTLQK